MKFGYNTNGFAYHALSDAMEILSILGYDGIALTVDVNHLNPFICNDQTVAMYVGLLRELSLEPVVETGGRYILDPFEKHEPSLVSRENRGQRLDFLRVCIEMAEEIGAGVVSFASGVRKSSVPEKEARGYLVEGIREVCGFAQSQGITAALEPEPGHFVETLADYTRIKEECGREDLRLTLDIGHIYCSEDDSPGNLIRRYGDEIANVHIEDIKGGVHNHLPPGQGDVDFAEALTALKDIGYEGLVGLELSRSSHDAPRIAREALEFMKRVAAEIEA